LSHQLEDACAKAPVTVPHCVNKAAPAAREAGVREVLDQIPKSPSGRS
jgi:hypothetical protein